MRIAAVLLLSLCFAACKRGLENEDAVRQGVIDYLSTKTNLSLTISAMDITVTSVKFNGNQADADVSFTPKGGNPAAGMSKKYHLEQKDNRWVVTGSDNAGSSPHGGGMAMPGAESPHGAGGATPGAENPHGAAGAPGKMPSPEDLPPAPKKK